MNMIRRYTERFMSVKTGVSNIKTWKNPFGKPCLDPVTKSMNTTRIWKTGVLCEPVNQ